MPTIVELEALLEVMIINSRTQNPYPDLDGYYSDGLDYIIANIGATPGVDALVSTVLDYINTLSWFSSTPGSLPIEISSVAYSAINSYMNGQVGTMYSGTQRMFVNNLIGPNFIDNTVDSIPSNFLLIQDVIPKSGMSIEAQTPLFFATAMGASAYGYWMNQINLGVGSAWNSYFSTALTSATANVPFWVAAGMEGALIGAASTPTTMIEPTTAVVSNKIISSLIAALTIGAGKVIFKWVPKDISNGLNTNSSGNFSAESIRVVNEILSNDPEGVKLVGIYQELNERVEARAMDENQAMEALKYKDIGQLSALFGYSTEEFIGKARQASIYLNNLMNRYPVIKGSTFGQYTKPGEQKPQEDPCAGKNLSWHDCMSCYSNDCSASALCFALCNLIAVTNIVCYTLWSFNCWWYDVNPYFDPSTTFTSTSMNQ